MCEAGKFTRSHSKILDRNPHAGLDALDKLTSGKERERVNTRICNTHAGGEEQSVCVGERAQRIIGKCIMYRLKLAFVVYNSGEQPGLCNYYSIISIMHARV